ncbi:MAG: glucose-6-phosphate dehydrogenase assembly protein OpcA [Phormidium tanganyikae FI6-MK23]|jgi:glucose-6-phosphate dehydrogenase assembly protein OpcA|nr:glucose-6-phosphate dehydrogenase assembly protein OpcA [Phormidium tanganyikae FI6-MK23]
MATKSAPLVSLQAPKDVSLNEIEQELNQIWQSYSATDDDGSAMAATRATTFTLIVYEPEETQRLLAMMGFYTGPVDGIDGPRTEAAIQAAQSAYKLPIDGKSSPELLTKLREDLAKRKGEPVEGADAPRYASDAAGSGIADAIASQNPCRIISLFPIAGEDEGVSAQVSAYCPINKASQAALVCCEYITLKGTEPALDRVGELASSLLISELPRLLWWKGTPNLEQNLFQRLSKLSNQVIFDSSRFTADTEGDLLKLAALIEDSVLVTDLNWRRLAAWQELAAETFDAPGRREAIWEVDRVVIDYEKGNPAQALMYLGWLASRLGWEPTKREHEGDIYDLQRVYFTAADGREIEAELAGIPTAEIGEVKGDMVSLKLTSTNLKADCCTVLCSETTGCMRMEAGGGAQSCQINQVTPLLNDQKAETLLSEQLQRVGQDVLYEESMAVTAKIIKL